jgi:hypothetical protein
MYKNILRPFLFLFDPEWVHHLVFKLPLRGKALRAGVHSLAWRGRALFLEREADGHS